MTITDYIGNENNLYLGLIVYFTGDLETFYNAHNSNWYTILYNIAEGVKLKSFFESTEFRITGETIYTQYCQKWEHLAKLFMMDYNPIENYSMKENMLDFTETGGTKEYYVNYTDVTSGNNVSGQNLRAGKLVTGVSSGSGGGSVTVADGDENISREYTTTMDDTITERLRSSDKTQGTTATDTQSAFYTSNTKNGDHYTDEITTGKKITDTITETELDPNIINGHKGNRSGNIGVTTTQQMAMSEIDYANYLQLAKIICCDIIDFLSAGVYECDG